ncbi:hypothetical protein PPACK8108_LOCUS13996 [Phakopsora pachyrhizi]|uniref:Uncharacterized protein n=1 Tax=Phakopsora pachyrhizi TaxID=170000 RepID=A0AAV0B7J3_PHAPC|nr:hypothetical protein PPACK8108_LOCUS13996 [Phakopsora pachyrhizi]
MFGRWGSGQGYLAGYPDIQAAFGDLVETVAWFEELDLGMPESRLNKDVSERLKPSNDESSSMPQPRRPSPRVEETSEEAVVAVGSGVLGDELEGDADVEDGASWRPIGITSTRQEDNFWLMRVKVGDHPARKPVGSLDHDQRIVGWQDEIRDW